MTSFGGVKQYIDYRSIEDERAALRNLTSLLAAFKALPVQVSGSDTPLTPRVLAVVGARLLDTDKRSPVLALWCREEDGVSRLSKRRVLSATKGLNRFVRALAVVCLRFREPVFLGELVVAGFDLGSKAFAAAFDAAREGAADNEAWCLFDTRRSVYRLEAEPATRPASRGPRAAAAPRGRAKRGPKAAGAKGRGGRGRGLGFPGGWTSSPSSTIPDLGSESSPEASSSPSAPSSACSAPPSELVVTMDDPVAASDAAAGAADAFVDVSDRDAPPPPPARSLSAAERRALIAQATRGVAELAPARQHWVGYVAMWPLTRRLFTERGSWYAESNIEVGMWLASRLLQSRHTAIMGFACFVGPTGSPPKLPRLLVPVHNEDAKGGGHWCLMLLSKGADDQWMATLYNSLVSTKMKDPASRRAAQLEVQPHPLFVTAKDHPQQPNGNDCGPATCASAMCLACDLPPGTAASVFGQWVLQHRPGWLQEADVADLPELHYDAWRVLIKNMVWRHATLDRTTARLTFAQPWLVADGGRGPFRALLPDRRVRFRSPCTPLQPMYPWMGLLQARLSTAASLQVSP
jgi:hypothetical protein